MTYGPATRKGESAINYVLYAIITSLVTLGICALASEGSVDPKKDVNVAEFGTPWLLTSEGSKPVYAPEVTDNKADTSREVRGGRILQIEWDEPRDVSVVAVKGPDLPDPQNIEIQYWYCVWPDNGSGGWARLDDPFRGKWVAAKTEAAPQPDSAVYTFAPLDKEENPKIENTGAGYRRTYKIGSSSSPPQS